ncbi:MAG: thioesterase family protein [Marmoricola sp.]
MDAEFDRDIAVRQSGDGEYAAELGAGWLVGGGVNGGYVLAVLGNAAAELAAELGHPDPFIVNAHYLTASRPGPAVVRVRLVRNGGSLTTVAASLSQQQDGAEVERVTALASYGDLTRLGDDVATTAGEPELPPRDQCVPNSLAPAEVRETAPLLDRFELLADPACVGWTVGKPSVRGMLQGWFRLNDERDLDARALLLAVDALPPVTFDLGLPGWAPTLELSVHVRAVPAPGWVKLRHATHNVAGGYFEEDCEVWDSTGRLVAQSRQLARAPRRP